MLPLFLIKKPKKKRRHFKPDSVDVAYKISQRTVTSWPAVTIPKQGPFSALFLSK